MSGPTPALSVIVPVFRQWDLAPGLLAALADQDMGPGAVEILLIDNDPGTPPPPALVAALPATARLLPCPAPGSYAARNAGAAAARGELLVFTDVDCRPRPGWLAALARAAKETPGMLLAGAVEMEPAPATEDGRVNPFAAYDRIRGIPQALYVAHGYGATANLATPRAVFERLGGFDAKRFSGGDAAFCRRAGRAGHGIRLVEAAVVRHPCRDSWATLATKARRVKGGQIAGGAVRSRAIWLLRSLTPPLRATLRFLRARAPWVERRAAIGVLYRLWGVELAEIARLLAGGRPERR
jgi:glycosyltransferase involved in cell wall biosynthesis